MPFSAASDDRVKETSSSTGTGNFTLAGAVAQFVSCNTAFGLNKRFTYSIVGQTGIQWETGIGYLSGTTTLVRELPSKGSAAVPVNFSAATYDVFCTLIGAEENTYVSKGRALAMSKSLGMN